MKKSIALLISLFLICITAFAFAEVDLSGMTYNELVTLKDQINKAMWESEEWQEVTVPQGVYVVGDDIPAGHWTLLPAEGQSVTVKWGDALDESGRDITFDGNVYEYERLVSADNKYYDVSDKTQIDYELKDGQYIIVDDGQVVFTPYAGKPSLGFK